MPIMGAQENIVDVGQERAPPSYEDADTAMIDDHIEPSAPQDDDEKAIDIRVDGADPFAAPWSAPLPQDTNDAAALTAAAPQDPPSLFVPGLAMRRATGLCDGTTHVCIDLIAHDVTKDANATGGPSSSSSIHSNTGGGASSSSSSSVAQPGAASGPTQTPVVISRRDLEDSLPHPHAVLSPDRMEWFVVLRQDDHVKDPAKFALEPVHIGDAEGAREGEAVPLWRDEGTVTISAQEQKRTIFLAPPLPSFGLATVATAGQDSLVESVETFHRLNSTEGGALLMTSQGQITSVVPWEMLETFKQRRLSYTAPNVKPIDSFKESANVLIR